MNCLVESGAGLALAEQYAFIRGAIGRAQRVLEVGAGSGQVARRLQESGLLVTALDLSLPGKEQRSGVQWVEADFLGFDAEPFDAVVFTASLHHISPLDAALDRAKRLLVPGGVLAVDDFDVEAPDACTARWYYDTQELLATAGVYDPAHAPPSRELAPLESWREDHRHEDPPLHTGRAMLAGIEERFAPSRVTRVAYLYRHICAGLRDASLAGYVKSLEERYVTGGIVQAVGLRIIARRA
jgi:SAM-dependent methyltransferase